MRGTAGGWELCREGRRGISGVLGLATYLFFSAAASQVLCKIFSRMKRKRRCFFFFPCVMVLFIHTLTCKTSNVYVSA